MCCVLSTTFPRTLRVWCFRVTLKLARVTNSPFLTDSETKSSGIDCKSLCDRSVTQRIRFDTPDQANEPRSNLCEIRCLRKTNFVCVPLGWLILECSVSLSAEVSWRARKVNYKHSENVNRFKWSFHCGNIQNCDWAKVLAVCLGIMRFDFSGIAWKFRS